MTAVNWGTCIKRSSTITRETACHRFTTVLGPGDPNHESHIHLDIIKRRGGYRMCQWEVRVPPPPIPLPRPRPAEADLVNHSKKL